MAHTTYFPFRFTLPYSVYLTSDWVYIASWCGLYWVYFAPGLGIYCTEVGCILHRDWIYVAPYIYIFIYTFYIYSFIHLLYKKQLFFLKLRVILHSVKYFYYILNKRRKVMYTTVANDFILVERKILYNDSLNCREKIALIILLDTDN